MNEDNFESIILQELYIAYFSDKQSANLNTICENQGWNKDACWKIADSLTNRGLIRPWTMGGNFVIDAHGVIYVEDRKLVQSDIIQKNSRLRTAALDVIATDYEESFSRVGLHIEMLAQKTGFTTQDLADNLLILDKLGYVDHVGGGLFKITSLGLEAVTDLRKRREFAQEFERISTLNPQPRGRALQKLLAHVIEYQGWHQQEGVRTSNEEIDVILAHERDYFLVECKWEKDPVEASVVRELHGKLSNRSTVQGIIFSMSGFTEGAKTQVEDYANSRVICLFGPNDIKALIYSNSGFDSMLNTKDNQIITRRSVAWS
ncbi:MAG: restriction endonuclease [SAR202 cluster bacterium]|nr:restriction endonuclease [SAR202 cluster bacterium]